MTEFDWRNLLAKLNAAILQSDAFTQDLPQSVVTSGWLGYPGATESQLEDAEARLGQRFPPSYRDFLRLSNGWRVSGPFVDRLWSADKVDWFRVRHQRDWIDSWIAGAASQGPPIPVPDNEYFVYGADQNVLKIRVEYLPTSLEISDVGDSAVYLLNPNVIGADGEWEAWFFASWLPGARRYRSFWDLMRDEYESLRGLYGV